MSKAASNKIWVCRPDFPFDGATAKKLGVKKVLHPDASAKGICPHCKTKMNVSMIF